MVCLRSVSCIVCLLIGLVTAAFTVRQDDGKSQVVTLATYEQAVPTVTGEIVAAFGSEVYLRNSDGLVAVKKYNLTTQAKDVVDRFTATNQAAVQSQLCKVVRVTDGDTLVVELDGQRQSVRLNGIDAPESTQNYGEQSRDRLASLVGSSVVIYWKQKDKYRRLLADVVTDDADRVWVNRQLVQDGAAWHYKEYSDCPVLAATEEAAKKERVGLWADATAQAPWDFRHHVASQQPTQPEQPPVIKQKPPTQRNDSTAESSSSTIKSSQAQSATVYITKTGTKYHASGCRYLSKSRITTTLDAVRGRYGPCSVCNPPR